MLIFHSFPFSSWSGMNFSRFCSHLSTCRLRENLAPALWWAAVPSCLRSFRFCPGRSMLWFPAGWRRICRRSPFLGTGRKKSQCLRPERLERNAPEFINPSFIIIYPDFFLRLLQNNFNFWVTIGNCFSLV